MEGVEGYFDHTHVPGRNDIGPVLHDEEAFATKTVTCIGQIIGALPLMHAMCLNRGGLASFAFA